MTKTATGFNAADVAGIKAKNAKDRKLYFEGPDDKGFVQYPPAQPDLQTGLELETNFISSLFADTLKVVSLMKELPDFSSDYFMDKQYALIYDKIVKRVDSGLPCGLEDIAGDLQGQVRATVISEAANYFPGMKDPLFYARQIREAYHKRTLFRQFQKINDNYDEMTLEDVTGAIRNLVAEIPKPKSNLCMVSASDFLEMKFPPRENLLDPWLPTQGLAMLYAIRGLGKTLLSLLIAVVVTGSGSIHKWRAQRPRGVLYLDGEMPAVVMQERLARAIEMMDSEPVAPLRIITPDLQDGGMPNLATWEGQEAIEPYLEGIDLIIVDNISTLCRGGRENEGESWEPVQGWALKQRAQGRSVLFVHHAGKGGAQRGTSRREDILDTVINLRRPGDYTPDQGAYFEVHFEKSRGIYGDNVTPFEMQLKTLASSKQQWNFKDIEESLTEKVARMLNDGVPQNEIPELLKISKGTVSKHKTKAMNLGLLI
ncbi:MAG: AAA family ATPase [Nitrospirae bacterium]|nr:AAA family ATPase [Nitrospirota bacterium]